MSNYTLFGVSTVMYSCYDYYSICIKKPNHCVQLDLSEVHEVSSYKKQIVGMILDQ